MKYRAYWAFFKMRLINNLQYRTAALAGMVTQFFWGGMEILLYSAFYDANPERFPMAFSALVGYIWLRQAFLALLDTWSVDKDILDMILNGNVAYELCRPVNLYAMWFARTIANRFSRAALRCMPILILAFLLPEPYGLTLPTSLFAFLAFFISLILSACVLTSYVLIIYGSCFYTTSSDGIRAILTPITSLLSGELIPLPFMPDSLTRILEYSPFGAMSNAPLRIYSGDIAGMEILSVIGLQIFWLAIFVMIGYGLQRRGMRRLCVQGG